MTFVRLTGPQRTPEPLSALDPRTAAWRRDLADLSLADAVVANAYARPVMRAVAVSTTPLLDAPDAAATAVSELLHGERFAVLDEQGGFAWGYGGHDHYVGWVGAASLGPATPGPASLVGPGDALLFDAPRVKAPVVATLPAGAEIHADAVDERFLRIDHGPFAGRYLHRRHVLASPVADWVAIAEQFRGAPYRWGGRTRAGVDCSGLIAVAWKLAGRPCPRDSDMLFAVAGDDVAPDSLDRGDILWWPGHIGVMASATSLLHANAHFMAAVVEPLAQVIDRAGAIPSARRPR
jgi:cell wall-associated NlpC family hydrolase